jgi:hypothetical protein
MVGVVLVHFWIWNTFFTWVSISLYTPILYHPAAKCFNSTKETQTLSISNTLKKKTQHTLFFLLLSFFHFKVTILIIIKSINPSHTEQTLIHFTFPSSNQNANKQTVPLRRRLPMALSVSDVAAMYSLLANSMSADHRLRGPAEEALAQSESRRGFCSCLLVLFFISLRVPMNFALCFLFLCYWAFAFGKWNCRKWLLLRIWRRKLMCV